MGDWEVGWGGGDLSIRMTMTQGIKLNGTLKIAFSEPISLYNTGCNGSNVDRVRNEPCFKFVYVSAVEPTQ